MLRNLFRRDRTADAAAEIYEKLVEQSRLPVFYKDHGVPDTLDGRFDLLVLHVSLLMIRLKEAKAESEAFTQHVFDIMFVDMDQSLREIGVSDMSVGKKVKQMGKAFYGRLAAYEEALMASDEDGGAALADALFRNLYRGEESLQAHAGPMAQYAIRQLDYFADQPASDILEARLSFLAV